MAKPPVTPRRVPADTIEVVVDGVTYRPHEGESVWFKGRPSVGLYLELSRISEEGGAGLARLLPLISDWDWTDDEGNAYPRPPTLDALMSLPKEELNWLIGAAGAEAPVTEGNLKNGGGASI